MARNKISVIGAGNVGATTALMAAQKELGDVVLVDIIQDMPQGKGLDMLHAMPVFGCDVQITGTNGYGETKDSDVVVITSGLPRKPGMTREDLLKTNLNIVKEVTEKVVKESPKAILIIVSNPLDAMTYVAYKVSKFPKERVMGMAGVLDSSRFRAFLAMELNVSVKDITAFVLGGHGDTMVPSIQYTTVGGVPVKDLVPKDRLDKIVDRTRNAGTEIVKLLKTGSAYYSPAASSVEMVEAILKDKKKIVPCAALCKGEYGFQDLFVGVPAKLGRKGVEQIIEFKLSPDEAAALKKSADAVKSVRDEADALLK